MLPFGLDPDDFVIKPEASQNGEGLGIVQQHTQHMIDPRDLPYLVKELTGMRVIAIEQLLKDD